MIPWSIPRLFDYGIIGEGEEAFLRLIKFLQNDESNSIEQLNNVLIWDVDELKHYPKLPLIEPLDNIPFPDRESIENIESIITADRYKYFMRTGLRSLQVTTSRGCPYKCKFCQPSALWDKYRAHSNEYTSDEIEYIHSRFGINAILIEDDLFTSIKKRIAGLNESLGKKNLLNKIVYYVAARASQIDEEWVNILKELGVVKVEFGIESGSEKIAEYLKNERLKNEEIKNAINLLNK